MILVKNRLSLGFSNAFIPPSNFNIYKNRGKHTKSHWNKNKDRQFIFARFQGTFHCMTMETRLRKATDSLHDKKTKERKPCSLESGYEDFLFLCYFIPLEEIKIYQLKTWFIILLLYTYIF